MGKQSGGMAGVFGFDSAILILKAGGRVRRNGWGQNGNWLQITTTKPSEHQFVASLQRSTSDGFTVPYTPTALDLLADDWTAEHIGDMLMIKDA